MTHLTFDEISELAEGREPGAEGHLAECAECRATLSKVRELIHAAQALPRDIAPPPEVWTALRSRVAVTPTSARRTSRWIRGSWIAVAAVAVLVAGMTLLLSGGPSATARNEKLARMKPTPATPTLVLAVDNNYAATVAELRNTLETQRATLSPATIRVLERSLATIDTAIAEARQALADDPANQTLLGILSANYEHKVQLLKRATQLTSSS